MPAGCIEVGADESGQGLGDFDITGSEVDRNPVAAVVCLAACHRCDSGELLAVEQHEAAGDAIDGLDEIGSLFIGLAWLAGLLLVAGVVLARGGKST